MVNQTFIQQISAAFGPQSWEYLCLSNLNSNASGYDWSTGLVNGDGKPVASLTDATWGIDVPTCYKYCDNPFASTFSFQQFTSSTTNYFLPWLALTAQLPFETGDPWTNVMSYCLALGSPSLITFSLTTTILNRAWALKNFSRLGREATNSGHDDMATKIESAMGMLEAAQQAPLRASQERGWLSSLIVAPANVPWWKALRIRLKSTRRPFTASLVAQMLAATISYLFIVIASFAHDLGDITTALDISAGSLWIWLIPVILGWITVGTQYWANSIDDALKDAGAHRALEPDQYRTTSHNDVAGKNSEQQRAIAVRSGLTPTLRDPATTVGQFEAHSKVRLEVPMYWGADIQGDEKLEGPIFNYARQFTWWQLAVTLQTSFRETLQHMDKRIVCGKIRQPGGDRTDEYWDSHNPSANLEGDSLDTATYCGLTVNRPVQAYPSWGSALEQLRGNILTASFAALCLQWGTTGASILIAYTSPTQGLGCRSGSYLIYGILGTAAWLLLFASMLLSHEVMLRYQTAHITEPTKNFLCRDKDDDSYYSRSSLHSFLCAAAVTTRRFGKFLAVVNTIWLVLSSILEFTGGHNNCWCKGNVLSYGDSGWIVLFKDAKDLALEARLSWGGGLALALIVIFAYTLFALAGMKRDDE